jgi:hypothetical protein
MARYSDILKFVNENGSWYVYLPNFFRQGGTKEQLRMRDGAEILLNYLADGNPEVVIEVSEDPISLEPDHIGILDSLRDTQGGADYLVYDINGLLISAVWLSEPVKLYFGNYPDKFYIRKLK